MQCSHLTSSKMCISNLGFEWNYQSHLKSLNIFPKPTASDYATLSTPEYNLWPAASCWFSSDIIFLSYLFIASCGLHWNLHLNGMEKTVLNVNRMELCVDICIAIEKLFRCCCWVIKSVKRTFNYTFFLYTNTNPIQTNGQFCKLHHCFELCVVPANHF